MKGYVARSNNLLVYDVLGTVAGHPFASIQPVFVDWWETIELQRLLIILKISTLIFLGTQKFGPPKAENKIWCASGF